MLFPQIPMHISYTLANRVAIWHGLRGRPRMRIGYNDFNYYQFRVGWFMILGPDLAAKERQ